MTGGQRVELERLARSHTAPTRDVRQAKALLLAADSVSNAEIARRCASTPKSVRRWRSRFAADGTAAVGRIRAGRGRPGVLGDDVVEAIVNDTLHTVPATATVFCLDEKTQVQALDRTQPSLPMVPVRAGTMTHDYKRNGTLDLFAALNVGSGEVLHDTRRSAPAVTCCVLPPDRHARRPDLELHVILDNLSAHKSQPVRDWLAHKKRRRWHLHFTPTSSSWHNLVECWFSVLSRKALTNTSFTSVAELETRIDCWVSHWNDSPEPFVWTKPADSSTSRPRTSHPRPNHQSATHPLAIGSPLPCACSLPSMRNISSTGWRRIGSHPRDHRRRTDRTAPLDTGPERRAGRTQRTHPQTLPTVHVGHRGRPEGATAAGRGQPAGVRTPPRGDRRRR